MTMVFDFRMDHTRMLSITIQRWRLNPNCLECSSLNFSIVFWESMSFIMIRVSVPSYHKLTNFSCRMVE